LPVERYNVGLIQMSCGPEPEENLARALAKIREAAKMGANVVCLPELFSAQYFCQREDAKLFDLAEAVPGPTTDALGKAARESKVVVIGSIFEKRARGM
jgi:N-carbamoylputrescine amidase